MIKKLPITFAPEEAFEVPIEDLERRERDEKIVNYFEDGFHILNAYQSHQKTAKQLRMSLKAFQLAMGFHLAAGADGPAALARQCGVDKQTLGKCLNHFIELLKLTPLGCQRNQEARKHMSTARKEQVEQKR
jgi:hypothetical protein